MATNTHNTLHKRYQHNLNQMKNILQRNNLTRARADKSKTMVIINKNTLKQKINTFIQENHITHLNKDPTDLYQNHIQQAIKKCNMLTDKHIHKHLINIKPMAPRLNAYIQVKTHKANEPIRPVMNSTHTPAHKIAKYLNKKLKNLICLPYTYTTKNSYKIAQELNNIQINEHNKIINLDIKDLYVNLPIQNILHITKFWLKKYNKTNTITEQTLYLLEVILKQNYFQYNNQYFQPKIGIAM